MRIIQKGILLWLVSLCLPGLDTALGQPVAAVRQPAAALHQYGIKGGVVLSGYEGDDYSPYLGYEVDWIQDDAGSPDVGFQIGLFYSRRLAPHWALQPELYLARRGLHFYKTTLYNTAYHLRAYYLQVPVLLRYRLFMAGPYAAVNVGARRTLDVWGERDTKSLTCVKRFDYGLVFAISPSFPAWSGRLIVEARVDIGLAHAMTLPDGYIGFYEAPNPAKIRAFTLMTGFRF